MRPPPDLAFNDPSGVWELSPGRCSLECLPLTEPELKHITAKAAVFLCPDPIEEVNGRTPDGQDCWGVMQAPSFACGTCTDRSAGKRIFMCVRCPLLLPLSRLVSPR